MQLHAALVGELDGVAEEIEQYLPHANSVGVDRGRYAGIHAVTHLQALVMGLWQQQAEHAIEQLAQVQRLRGDAQSAGLDLRVVEDVIEYLRQRLARFLGQREQALLLP
ncbi:hypothetical protein D3C81_1880090 [compost metagenome]